MGSIGDPITTAVPSVSAAGPQYASDIDSILSEVITRLTAKVPVSSINFNATANFNGSPIINAAYLTLVNSAVTPVVSPVNRVTSYLGDLWYVSPAGAIQLTTGNTLNAASIGGITGAYGGANPPQFRFDSVNARYDAYSNFSTGTFGFIRAQGYDIAASPTSALFARLLFAGSLNQTYTLPTAPPTTADRPLYMTTSGQITTGFASRHYQYGVTGAILSGTCSFTTGAVNSGTSSILSPFGVAIKTTAAADLCSKDIDGLPVGTRVTAVQFNINKPDSSVCTMAVYRVNNVGTATQLGTASTTTLGPQSITVTLSSPETVAVNTKLSANWINFGTGGSSTNTLWYGFDVIADMQP